MKKLLFALAAAILIAVQFLTPVSAAAPAAGLSSTICGDTYVVQSGDYLSLIARKCGTTLSSILALNPQIYNMNLIYAGQVIRLDPSASLSVTTVNSNYWYTGYGYYYPARYYTSSWVSISATRATAGSTLTVYVHSYPAHAEIDYRIGQQGQIYTAVVDGTTDANGYATATITIPSEASAGEYWYVLVTTTSLAHDVNLYSPMIFITG